MNPSHGFIKEPFQTLCVLILKLFTLPCHGANSVTERPSGSLFWVCAARTVELSTLNFAPHEKKNGTVIQEERGEVLPHWPGRGVQINVLPLKF